jgi:methionyl-tRNA formyltransferase
VNIILTGTRSFGVAVGEMLMKRGDQVLVWTDSADEKMSRFGEKWELDVLYDRQPPEFLASWGADVIVAAHSHAFISRPARAAAKLGALGYHPSLLPRHRGRDAVEWTIRMGDPVAGGSVYWFTDNVDGGPLAAQDYVMVPPGTTASELWRESLFPMGVRLLEGVLAELDCGIIREVPQDERCATWEPSIDRPPLFRPDLLQIGERAGYRTVVTRA